MSRTTDQARALPARVGRYEVLLPIASGGMATVYLARHQGAAGFTRDVALKVTHAIPSEESDVAYEVIEEAKLVSRIRHPNVVAVIDAGDDPEGVFLVMDYVEGETLAGLLGMARRREIELPRAVALRVYCDALLGLHAAHELRSEDGVPLGLVHRDFSPQNILVGVDGLGRLSDFGIAKVLTRVGLTQSGTIKGKLGYMSPEQVRGKPLDRRSDVWAAAVVLWEVLTGRRLFAGADQNAVLFKIVSALAPRVRSAKDDVAQALDDVVAAALVHDPAARPGTIEAFRQRIEAACAAADVRIATASEVSAFMEGALAARIAERREQVARARTERPPLEVDDEPTDVDATFTHRNAVTKISHVRERARTRRRIAMAVLTLVAGFIVVRTFTSTEVPLPAPARVAPVAVAAPSASAPGVLGVASGAAKEPDPPPSATSPARARAGARPGSPREAPPPPARRARPETAAPPAAEPPLTAAPRSPFHNPYEDKH